MRVVIAPDKFKGSLDAAAAADAIARGWRAAWPEAETRLAPIADGGEGFAAALSSALDGEWIETQAHDPLGREVVARYTWIEAGKLAVLDMSEAAGLWRLKPEERNPLRANTYGVGQLIRHAAERGARRILVGLGGSATTDAGVGMAAALGYEMLTSDGEDLAPLPENMTALIRIQAESVMDLPEIVAASDVRNPLLGPRGAARVFAPQKGADAKTVEALEYAMQNVADVVQQDLECDFRDAPGAGAAGGLGFGLLSFCQASIRSGFDVVAEALRLEELIADSDLVLTGEGRIDGQTLEGKGPAGVAALARRHGKPVIAFGGSISDDANIASIFDGICPIIDQPTSLADAMKGAGEFLERAAQRTGRLLRIARPPTKSS
jgi:glycerate kinase